MRHLLLEDIGSTSRCDKAEEWWRRIERTRAEFWVRLQANEERVICGISNETMVTGWVQTGSADDALGSSIICMRSPFSSRPINAIPLACKGSTYVGFTSYR